MEQHYFIGDHGPYMWDPALPADPDGPLVHFADGVLIVNWLKWKPRDPSSVMQPNTGPFYDYVAKYHPEIRWAIDAIVFVGKIAGWGLGLLWSFISIKVLLGMPDIHLFPPSPGKDKDGNDLTCNSPIELLQHLANELGIVTWDVTDVPWADKVTFLGHDYWTYTQGQPFGVEQVGAFRVPRTLQEVLDYMNTNHPVIPLTISDGTLSESHSISCTWSLAPFWFWFPVLGFQSVTLLKASVDVSDLGDKCVNIGNVSILMYAWTDWTHAHAHPNNPAVTAPPAGFGSISESNIDISPTRREMYWRAR